MSRPNLRRPSSRAVLLLASAAVAVALTVLAVVVLRSTGPPALASGADAPSSRGTPHDPPVFDPSTLAHEAAAMVQRTPKPLDTSRLAAGLVPPTNRWFSSLALGPAAQSVFPVPMSFTESGSGFSFGVPRVSATADTIAGPASHDVTVTVPGLHATVVSGYDDLTVTLDLRAGDGSSIAHLTIAEGSPVLTLTASRATTLTLSSPVSGPHLTTSVNGRTYGAMVSGGQASGASLRLRPGGRVTWFAVPDSGSAAAMARVVGPVSGGHAAYQVSGNTATTRLTWDVPGGGQQVFAVMPHQDHGLARGVTCDLGTFPSVYGTLHVCRGPGLTWTAPVHPVTPRLDLGGLSASDRSMLERQVRADVASTPAFPADTYFGGKALQRSTQLYVLARQLGMTDVADSVRATLVHELDRWTQPTGCARRSAFCFVYDPKGHGLIGMTPSFGSDKYNDHHFHYGYFLYTAGILAADDPALVKRWAPVMDLVAADIASSGDTPTFPDRRTFDAYAAHSWASGTAPFADGNNQESSSEAVNAWVGLSLWAKATGNAGLHDEATWMLSGEEATALAYGLRIPTNHAVYHGFAHRIVSLNWGGKRDYATWFSPAPAAKLAILVLPASPSAAGYLRGDPAAIRAAVAEARGSKGYDQQFGDYLLMYSALAGRSDAASALTAARSLPQKDIDGGDSRAYLLAWILAAER